jgi:hypothetical protein
MRITRCNIFWESMASPYLELYDLAVFEIALSNDDIRNKLLLKCNMVDDKSESAIYDPNPYEINYHIDESIEIHIISNEMETWCNRRHIRISNMVLKPRPGVSYHVEDDWDVMKSVERIHFTNLYRNIDTKSLLSRLTNLKYFSYWIEHRCDSTIEYLIHQHHANSTRSSSPCSILGVSLSCRYISATMITELIKSIPTIEEFMFRYERNYLNDLSGFRNEHVSMIAERWKNLRQLILHNRSIYDDSLIHFQHTGQKFTSIQLTSCKTFSILGLASLLTHSAASLTHLILRNLSICEADLITILPNFHQLRVLEFDNFGDNLLQVIGQHCPKLTSLRRVSMFMDSQITDDGIQALTNGCKSIEVIVLGNCPSLSWSSFPLLVQVYANTLKQFFIKIVNYPNPALFKDCRYPLLQKS